MVNFSENNVPLSPSSNEHQLHRTSTDIVDAAEAAEHSEADGDISFAESKSDGTKIQFKKAKKLGRKASKHYLKHLTENKPNRFKDWKRDHLIRLIIFHKKIELRNEKLLETEALRDLCESLYAEEEELPKKPPGPDFATFVKQIVAARRIQNTWIIYQAIKREFQEDLMADSYNNRIEDFDDSNLNDLGRAEMLMMAGQDDVVAEAGIEPEHDIESSGKQQEVHEEGAFQVPKIVIPKMKEKRNILDLPWAPPDYNKASAYANYIQPRKGGKGGVKFDYFNTTTGRHCCLQGWGEQFDLWNEGQISEFSPYGPGITNYFKFLKWAFWIFFLLTIAALPCLVINMSGSNGNQGLSSIARTTIGNLGASAGGVLFYENSTGSFVYNTTTNVHHTVNIRLPGCSNYGLVNTECYLNGDSLALFYAIIDIIVSCTLFLGYCWLSVFERLEETGLEENTVLASHYTVKVSRFTPDTTEEQLKDHFTKLVNKKNSSAVADVSFAYNNAREILLCKSRGDLIRKKVRLVHEHRFKCTGIRERTDWSDEKKNEVIAKERERLKETMTHYNEDLKRKDKELESISQENPKPIAAFVTFNYVTDQQLALEKYTHRSFISMLCGHPELNLNGKYLNVRQAAEPSVIVWENIQFTDSDRFGRNVATFLMSLLLVAISLAMIFSSKYLEQKANANGSGNAQLCPTNFYTFSEEQQLAITEQYSSLLYCYCGELSLQTTSSVCTDYFTRQAQAQVLTYFASFIVIIVNNLIVRMVRYSAQFEKHHSSDGQSMSIFLRLFILKYINTAAVFFINGNNVILQKLFGIKDATSSSVEFGSTWYSTVAVTIVLVQLGDAFNAQLGNLKEYTFLEHRKKLSRADPKFALTQDELNRSHVGPQFEFAFNYAQIMSTFFVCLTFSTGIPVLYPIAAFNFLLFYFSEKYMFIHLYKIPPHFTTLVGRRATTLIPIAILMHLAMSIWMLSNNELFVSKEKTQSDEVLVSSFKFGGTIRDKIVGQATFPLFMTFCAVIVVHLMYFYYKYSRKTIDRVYDFLFGFVTLRKKEAKIKKEQKENWKAKVPFARAVLRNLIKGLSSYNILRNPEYKEAFGITWKFAVENKGVRAVRRMKAKAQAAVEEEDAEKAEELQRRSLMNRSNDAGGAPSLKSTKKVKGLTRGNDNNRNRSFYGALAAQDLGSSSTDQTPTNNESLRRHKMTSPTMTPATSPRPAASPAYYYAPQTASGQQQPYTASPRGGFQPVILGSGSGSPMAGNFDPRQQRGGYQQAPQHR